MTRVLSRWRPVAAAGLLLVLMASPTDADGQPVPDGAAAPVDQAVLEEAHARFRRGLELYEEDNFGAALVEFQRANELAPSFRILYNIAQVQFELKDYAGALRSFQRYLDEGGDRVDEIRRKDVEQDIKLLRTRVGSLEIASEPGAEIYVDDVLFGTMPLQAPIIVSAGQRKLTARLEGYVPVTKRVDVAGGDALTVRLDLVRAEPTVVAPPPPSTTAPPPASAPSVSPPPPAALPNPTRPREVPWVGWTITGALAAGATVTGVLALRASNDLQDKRESVVGRDALDDASRQTQRYAVATDILAAGAVVAGGISLYLTLDRDEPAGRDTGPQVGVHVMPRSVGLHGTF